jgi:hypothetical protein
VTERPLICADSVVRAILDGRQTVDRRPVRCERRGFVIGESDTLGVDWPVVEDQHGNWHDHPGPWRRGDLLYVRECWTPADHLFNGGYSLDEPCVISYRADKVAIDHSGAPPFALDTRNVNWGWNGHTWRPSIHMAKKNARIWLRVADVRVERLQAITEADARAEGIERDGDAWLGAHMLGANKDKGPRARFETARAAFAHLWDSLYLRRGYTWKTSMHVWRTAFKVVSTTGRGTTDV